MILTVDQVAAIWIDAGGSRASVATAVAVATAESGRNPAAVSPDGGYGLFQIQASVWVGALPITRESLLDANNNARVAAYISHNGANWAAWCTMWANPVRDCGHGNITYPQVGSAAYRYRSLGAGLFNTPNPPPPPPNTGNEKAATESGWNQVRDWFGGGATKQWQSMSNSTKSLKRSIW